MKKLTRITPLILLLMILAGIVTSAPFTVQAATSVKVTKSQINSSGASSAIQSALNRAKSSATASNPYTVTVEGGSYSLNATLNIYSNTNLVLTGVTLVRSADTEGNLIHVGDNDDGNTKTGKTGYAAYKNISITNGTLNGKNRTNTLFKLAHCTNVKLTGTKFTTNNTHFIEAAAVDGFTVKNCSFSDMDTSANMLNYEAIQVDILHTSHFNTYRMEDIPCKNVNVDGCTFNNCPRGVGSHTSINNAPHQNITVNNCKFTNMKSAAVQFQGVENCKITNNTIDNTPRGIAVYSVMNNGNGCFKASILAKQGNVTAHYSDSYQTPKDSKIVISGNVLNRCGYIKDKYNDYDCLGIGAFGYNVTANTANLNKGNYYLTGVDIYDNQIEVKGQGIRIMNTRDLSIDNNIITCAASAYTSNDYYGISATESSVVNNITNNNIKKAHKNGIYIQMGSKCSKINNNCVTNTGKYGIAANASTITDINCNTIRNTGTEGVDLVDSTASNIKYNALSGIGTTGIYIDSGSNGGSISNNIVSSSGSGAVRVNGRGSQGSVYTNDTTSSISLNKSSLSMKIGESTTLTRTLNPTNSLTAIVWTSSNTGVVTVSGGKLTAKKEGSATITVTTFNGKTASCKVTVYDPTKAPSVKLSSTSCKLGVGDSLTLNATVTPAGSAVSWKSDNENVATVSGGKITAKSNGTANITASLTNGTSAVCAVTVYDAPSSVITNPQKLTLGVGEIYTISESTNSGSYANAANLKWTSSNSSAVSITKTSGNKAEIKALKSGSSDVTISLYNGLNASCAVTVKPAPSSVSINSGNINLGVGESLTIAESTNSGSYANAANLKWSSSNSAVVSVTKGSANKATVKGIKTGSANVTITLYNGKSATIKVSVKPAPSSVTVNPKSFKLGVGESLTVSESTNSGSYANAANLKWLSSNNDVATVTKGTGNKATVSAVEAGSADISINLYNGKNASSAVTVLAAPESVKLSAESLTLSVGQTYTIKESTSSGSYANAANLKWSSTNSAIATVTKGSANAATIKAVKKGTAYVRITLYNGLKAECKVTVK
ncbi:MAG: Ig-like domain-containing protein [Ruminococcus sp.]|nr:Ig-like domain-containing protein [Ruminococcus sp.]